jgi:16S rRNA (guanine(1405)-N(7))-methyltransferase
VDLDELVAQVLGSSKYREVAPALVRSIAARELGLRRSPRDALQATRNKLHQVAAAYFVARPPYTRWLAELTAAQAAGEQALRAACRAMLRAHASTRERLPILDAFYAETLAPLGPLHAVLDLACGLNPLTLPWMPLAPDAAYYAYDIYSDLARFLGAFLQLTGHAGRAEAVDVLHLAELPPVELALLLKALPCLEQEERDAAERLLESIPARHLLVSFPVHSLGGKDKHMLANYEARFRALLAGRGWQVERHAFSTELAFLVSKW